MKLLLDSHILLWWTGLSAGRVSQPLVTVMSDAEQVAISAATVWELEIKRNAGKIAIEAGAWGKVVALGIAILDITQEDAVAAASLPPLHRDPFDRMIVAQAKLRKLTLVTADAYVAAYDPAARRV